MFLIDLAKFKISVWEKVAIDDVPKIVNIFTVAPIELYPRYDGFSRFWQKI